MLKKFEIYSISFLIAFFLFVTWSLSISTLNLILIPFYVLVGKRSIKKDKVFYLLLMASVLAFFNLFLPNENNLMLDEGSSVLQKYIPYISLLLAAKIIGNYLTKDILRFLIFFIVLEAFCTVFQGVSGISGFWYNSYEFNEFGESMLYFSRPNGLSLNSSISSQKFLLGFWLLFHHKFFSRYKIFFVISIISILFALYYSFNRTVIATLVLGVFAFDLYNRKIKLFYKFILSVSFIGVVSYFSIFIVQQFLRGASSISESSSRSIIYSNGFDFIKTNLLLGNNSIKYFYGEKQYHLHNSFLELIASNGLLISFLVLLAYFTLLRRRNSSFKILLGFYSILQFGIFWGIGFFDIILFTELKDEKDY
jgi:hypothetical protein